MVTKKAPHVGDTTLTARAKRHLLNIGSKGGKRVVVDLDKRGHEALQRLVAAGYGGGTQRGAVNEAVSRAAEPFYN